MQGDGNNDNNQGDEGDKTDVRESDADHMSRFEGFTAKDGVIEKQAAKTDDKTKEGEAGTEDDKTKEGEAGKTKEGEAGKDGEKHRSADQRIGQAVAKQRAAERRADAAERRADSLEQRLANIEARLTGGGGGGKPAPAANAADKEPDPKDYKGGEFDTGYIRDLARYEAKQAANQTAEESRKAATTQQQREAAEKSQQRIDAFTEKAVESGYEDFAEVVFDESNKFSSTLVELALESEHGARISYELALDPKEQRRLAELSPAQQTRWFVQRELEISSATTDAGGEGKGGDGASDPNAKNRSKAPPPPKHQAKGNGNTGTVSAATTNFADFERMAMGKGRR